jgi:signal transduction histidine kinase
VLSGVLELSGKQLQHAGIVVQSEWDDKLPLVQVNPDHLKQVFLNLVLNAVDAMPAGGTLQVRTILDQLQTQAGPQPAVRIEFSDTGEGIPAEALPHIFEPFFTVKKHGVGLGLAISYGIIQAHKGQIQVSSREGHGSTFTILLPVDMPPPEPEL